MISAFMSATANGFAKNAFMPASTASDRADRSELADMPTITMRAADVDEHEDEREPLDAESATESTLADCCASACALPL